MRNLAAEATACSADNDGDYTLCTLAALQGPPYNFVGTDDVVCAVPPAGLGPNTWAGSCRHQDLPAGQQAVFSITGADAGQVETQGY